ncbi:MAG: transglutaminaseTgpA domain-containing protein [Acidobacteriota bacterium]
MSERLERQRWLGALALAVAAPLPLTGIVSWPFLVPFVAVGAALLLARRPLPPVPNWGENLLAPVILVLVVAAGGAFRFGVLRPVAQLAVLVGAVRLLGSHDPRRSGMALGLISLVGVAGVASSTHPSLAVYLLGLLAMVIVAVARLHSLTLAERTGGSATHARGEVGPPLRLAVVTVVIATLVAAPLFALFPRLRSPFAATRFGGRSVSGFREGVVLSSLGVISESKAPVMTVRFPGAKEVPPEWLRLVGATVQHYRGGLWARGRKNAVRVMAGAEGIAWLTDERPPTAVLQRAEFELVKGTDVLFVPPGAVRLDLPEGVPVQRDTLGVLRIPRGADLPVRYAVDFEPGRVVQPDPEPGDVRLPAEPERIVQLARDVSAGTGSPLAAALSIEEHLRSGYAYSTALNMDAPLRDDPVKWFLFKGKQGHCEFFASAMVILMRAVDLPARLQAGYAGGEPLGAGEFLVRESHAHAWVAGWTGGEWRVFDPTPAEGRPGLSELAGDLAWRMGWQRLEGLWDRWVLTFSLTDQVELASIVSDWVRLHGRRLAIGALALAGAATVTAFALRRRRDRARPPGPASPPARAIGRLLAAARRKGLVGPGEPTPRQLGERIVTVCADATAETRWLVESHERWRYGGSAAPPRGRTASAVRAVLRGLARVPARSEVTAAADGVGAAVGGRRGLDPQPRRQSPAKGR